MFLRQDFAMYPRLTFKLEGFLCLSFPSIRTTGRTMTPDSSSILLRSHFLFCPWIKFYWNTTTHITHMICVLSMVIVPLQPTCWVLVRSYLILKIQFFLFLFFSFPFFFFLAVKILKQVCCVFLISFRLCQVISLELVNKTPLPTSCPAWGPVAQSHGPLQSLGVL